MVFIEEKFCRVLSFVIIGALRYFAVDTIILS